MGKQKFPRNLVQNKATNSHLQERRTSGKRRIRQRRYSGIKIRIYGNNKWECCDNFQILIFLKLCGVCGDIAKSFHFGGLSCDSCKAFFRRSVHNDSYAAFRCPYNAHCNVDKSSRKGCQSCRFQKCLSIGMETKWVMGEDERNQLKQK